MATIHMVLSELVATHVASRPRWPRTMLEFQITGRKKGAAQREYVHYLTFAYQPSAAPRVSRDIRIKVLKLLIIVRSGRFFPGVNIIHIAVKQQMNWLFGSIRHPTYRRAMKLY